jgi:peptide/nickel transport system permease protein
VTPAVLQHGRSFLQLTTSLLLTLLGLVVLIFLIGRLLPADPVIAVVGLDAPQSVYLRVRHEMGLDQPVLIQFLRQIGAVMRLDFGVSFLTGNRVTSDIWTVLPASIELGLPALMLGAPVGIAMGVFAATRAGGLADAVLRIGGLVVYSVPAFLLSLIALLALYDDLDLGAGPGQVSAAFVDAVPPGGGFVLLRAVAGGSWALAGDVLSHMALPLLVLALVHAAWFGRFCRTLALEEINREYVLAARIKGMPERLVIWRHVFRNMRVQLLTLSAVAFASSLEGSVLVESIFAWPGFGQYFVTALGKGDMNAVVGCTFVVGLLFITCNMIAERLFRAADPRTR